MPNIPRRMTRMAASVLAVVLMGACSESVRDRDLVRYVDPEARFTVRLPEGHAIRASEPVEASATSPGLLAGVIASPAEASPSAAGGLGAGIDLSSVDSDQTTFQVFLLASEGFDSLGDMTLYFLTADPEIDVVMDDPLHVAGDEGRLVVADLVRDGRIAVEVAAAFSLGHDGVGYLIAAVFPAGTWETERGDFLRVVASFEPDVPPSLTTLPFRTGEAATAA